MTESNVKAIQGKTPVLALNSLLKGLKLLGHKGLRQFIFIPICINFVLYSLVLWLGYYYVSELINQFIPGWLSWLNWILIPLFFISFFAVGFFTFSLVANLIAAPFYSKLAAKTMSVITAGQADIEEIPVLQVLSGECKRIIYLISRALPLLLLFVIPLINIAAPFLWGLYGAWGLVMEYSAYPMENAGLLFPQQRMQLKQHRVGALTFGGLVMLGLSIPFFNILVPPAAVIGATLYRYELANRE